MSDPLPLPWLSEDEVEQLTGYVRPTCQARWLSKNGIRCYMNALGRVRVSRDALSSVGAPAKRKKAEPDLSNVRKVN